MNRILPAVPAVFFITFALLIGNGWAHDDSHDGADHGSSGHKMGHKAEGSYGEHKEKIHKDEGYKGEDHKDGKYMEYKKHEGAARQLKEEGSGSSALMEEKAKPVRKRAEGSMH